MLRTLLATTALTSILTVGAFAQDTAPEATDPAATEQQATMPAGVTLESGYTFTASDHLAGRILGQGIYTGAAADAEQIGDVNDMVINESGQIIGVVIGVGGFLGIGEKQVAVGYYQLEWVEVEPAPEPAMDATGEMAPADPAAEAPADPAATPAEPGTEPLPTDPAAEPAPPPAPEKRLVLSVTREQLEAAPDFVWDENANAMNEDPAAEGETGTEDGAAMDSETMEADPAAEGGEATMEADPSAEGEAAAESEGTEAEPAAEGEMAVEGEPAAEEGSAAEGDPAATTEEPAAEGDAAAQIDREAMTQVDATQLSAEELLGTRVLGMNDEDVGEIEDIALNADGGVEAIVIGVGGFLGIGEKQVAVSMDNLRFTVDEAGTQYVWINVTQEQLEQQPEYNPDEFSPDNSLISEPY